MHIQEILNEEVAQVTAPTVTFNDLNTLQVRTLLRIANGEVDVDSASEKEYDIMTDLVDLGLLDQEYQLSQRGSNAVLIAKKLGGSAEVQAARQRTQAMQNATGDVEDVEVALDTMDIDDDDVPDDDDFRFNITK